MRLMKEFGWQMTIWAVAKAMERNPPFAKACVREGHEIGAHGACDCASCCGTEQLTERCCRVPLA
ncbi:MAG: polysaccharide deacetylase family protein [Terriglobus roseus]|nr:polysaccharide deacetylase family protein [Terriglobus roseus]